MTAIWKDKKKNLQENQVPSSVGGILFLFRNVRRALLMFLSVRAAPDRDLLVHLISDRYPCNLTYREFRCFLIQFQKYGGKKIDE